MSRPGVRNDDSFRILERNVVFQGKVVGVSIDHIRFPGGHETRHEVLHLPAAVCVVPLLGPEGGARDVVLVEQFRNSIEGYIHEIPAGVLEAGEDPADCAARELEEETGYVSSRITRLATLFPIPGTSAHQLHFFLAEDLRPGTQRLEAAECLFVRTFPLDALVDAAMRGGAAPPDGRGPTIVDAKTQIGILHVAALLRRRSEPGRGP